VLDTESSVFKYFWIPAFAGMTVWETFYEAVTNHILILVKILTADPLRTRLGLAHSLRNREMSSLFSKTRRSGENGKHLDKP
jgi:hypothetical protein